MGNDTIPCPSCGYDLRGVPATGEFYRCPECGRLTNLASLARIRLNKRMVLRSVVIFGAILLLMLLVVALVR